MTQKFERKINRDPNEWWDHLTMAQKFAANSLFQYGYHLAFIRDTDEGKLAVLMRGEQLAAISADGEVDTNPNVVLRN
ncbi:hypothetical protein [Catenovulum maritimum]|uniref:Uncharacterized protein n=1 Tax=Catenovulum maritimum TaxID=1513271 RepID=A0A0J8GRR6_9ALTE|nr:hypothetical protein [Catenovulum maritimum]KMT63994.1 hypothetical protein XM47_16485 [Catenovulum maritimum]